MTDWGEGIRSVFAKAGKGYNEHPAKIRGKRPLVDERKKKRTPALRYLVPAVVLAVILCYALAHAIMIAVSQGHEQQGFENLRGIAGTAATTGSAETIQKQGGTDASLKGFQDLQALNPDFTAWLHIDDTLVDYPVMKSPESDPEFYLHRDFDKNESSSGCLFVGAGCTVDSDAFIIYGHNMSNSTMFGELDAYADYDYANEHQLIELATPTEVRRYRVFAAFQSRVYGGGESGFRYYDQVGRLSRKAYDELVETVRAASIIDIKNAPAYPQQILFLSTCSYHTDEGRFVVVAYRED